MKSIVLAVVSVGQTVKAIRLAVKTVAPTVKSIGLAVDAMAPTGKTIEPTAAADRQRAVVNEPSTVPPWEKASPGPEKIPALCETDPTT